MLLLLLLLASPVRAAGSPDKYFPDYRVTRAVGKSCAEAACERWSFKSLKPLTKEKKGATFLRFDGSATKYRSVESAADTFRKESEELTGPKSEAKGWEYRRLDGQSRYSFGGSCLFSEKKWAETVAAIDKWIGGKPAPGTVVACRCGGGCVIR